MSAGEFWRRETGHLPGSPTGLYRSVFPPLIAAGTRRGFARHGLPFDSLRLRVVDERFYWRIAAAGEDENERLEARAARALMERTWRADGARWGREKAHVAAANGALQDERIDRASQSGLADHLDRAMASFARGALRHFELTVAAGLPVGRLLAWGADRGIDAPAVLRVLEGASPASRHELDRFGAIAARAGPGPPPATLDELVDRGGRAATLLASYLREHRWHLVTGHDFDALTVGEQPGLLLASILAAPERRARAEFDPVAAARELGVPPADRGAFAALVDDARRGYALRDDNVRVCAMWPGGLVRRAVLEAGCRLAGRLADPAHAFELTLDEATAMLRGPGGPSAEQVAERRRRRDVALQTVAPDAIGAQDGDGVPPVWRGAVGTLVRAWVAYTMLWDGPADADALHGAGVGSARHTGRARVAASGAVDALAAGDVLVTAIATPDHAAIMPLLGGLVVEHGGVLSHAAVLAREHGIPAVVGARGALRAIGDGDLVELDAGAGSVTVLRRAGA